MQAVILAGGLGTRLKPYTTCFPKPLVPIDQYPIMEIVVRQLKSAGFEHLIISTGYLAELIKAYFGSGEKWGLSIEYVHEDKPLNTAGALKLITGLDQHFLVMNGDVLTTLNYTEILDEHIKHGCAATVAVKQREVKIDLGVIEQDEEQQLTQWIEKPIYPFLVSMGIYVLNRNCIDYIEHGEAIGMPDLLLRLKDASQNVHCHNTDAYWLDIGRVDDYAQAQDEFLSRKTEFLIDA